MAVPTGRPHSTQEPVRLYKNAKAAKVTTTNAANEKVGGLVHRTTPHGVGEIRTPTGTNSRTATDGVTATNTALTSATAGFDLNDVGATVTGAGIQSATLISTVTNATTVVLSKATTATASGVSITITRSPLRYVALRPMKVNGVLIQPGTIVPAANTWRNLHNYLSTGHLAVVGS